VTVHPDDGDRVEGPQDRGGNGNPRPGGNGGNGTGGGSANKPDPNKKAPCCGCGCAKGVVSGQRGSTWTDGGLGSTGGDQSSSAGPVAGPQARLDRIFDQYFSDDFKGLPRPNYDDTFTGARGFTNLDHAMAGQPAGVLNWGVGPIGMAMSDTAVATTLEHEYRGHIAAFLNGTHPLPTVSHRQHVAFETALNIADATFAASLSDKDEYEYRIANAEAGVAVCEMLKKRGE
jgi:hypothetical protein